MKIKRFFASEMREAIRLVKEDLGADAVILSNNKVDGGIELVAAIDYDEAAVQRRVDAALTTEARSSRRAAPGKTRPALSTGVKKQKITKHLEDGIKDDVISFSQEHSAEQKKVSGRSQFASLLKQSTTKAGAKKSTLRSSSAMSNNSISKNSTRVIEKMSLRDRKQPYISDEYEDNASDAYPFDYESLVKEEQARLQNKKNRTKKPYDNDLEDFYADAIASNKNRHGSNAATANKRSSSKSKVEWVEDPAITSMHEEIKSLRGILENQLSGLAWGDFARRHPHRAELLSRLYRLGIKSSVSEKLVKEIIRHSQCSSCGAQS